MRHVSCLGAPITPELTLDQVMMEVRLALKQDRQLLITFLNPLIFSEARLLRREGIELLRQFDLICCDGIGMVRAAQATVGALAPDRISFDETSIALPFFEACRDNGTMVVLVGGAPGVAREAGLRLQGKILGLDVAGAFDGFGEIPDACQFLRDHPRAVVVCGMGLPRQEKFLIDASIAGWNGVGATCGGYLDQILVGHSYYPRIFDRLNFRWLFRLYKEPRRLWRRYLVEYLPFIGRLMAAVIFRRRYDR